MTDGTDRDGDGPPLAALPPRGPTVGTREWLRQWVDVDAGTVRG